MQLPASSPPTDSSPLAALFPGAMPAGNKATPVGGLKNTARFDQIVDDLAVDTEPAEPTEPASDVTAAAAALALAFFPVPVVCPAPIPEPDADPAAEATLVVENGDAACGGELESAEAQSTS